MHPTRHLVVCLFLAAASGCGGQAPQGEGPGHRPQTLALKPDEELALGRKAYREVLSEAHPLPKTRPEVTRVRHVGERIAKTVDIEPLMREINLDVKDYRFEWEFNVVDERQVNAFCLPGGKVVVFTGLLQMVHDSDDELAAVMGHEIAHALAHHSSERLAREAREGNGILAALRGLSYDRAQESEADHIGVFLMTFAGYDPDKSLAFWKRMRQQGERQGHVPEILSDHPDDQKRIAKMEEWVPRARGAKRAYDEGRVAPASKR